MRQFVGFVTSVLVVTLVQSIGSAQELTERSLDKWASYLAPGTEECAWEGVAWRQSFRQAIVESQIDGKPILLWAMNGHPMGCV